MTAVCLRRTPLNSNKTPISFVHGGCRLLRSPELDPPLRQSQHQSAETGDHFLRSEAFSVVFLKFRLMANEIYFSLAAVVSRASTSASRSGATFSASDSPVQPSPYEPHFRGRRSSGTLVSFLIVMSSFLPSERIMRLEHP